MLTGSLVLFKEHKIQCETAEYGDAEKRRYVVISTEGLTMQISADAVRPFINQLETAEAELNRAAKEHIEDIRLHRYTTEPAGQDVTAEELKGIIQGAGAVTA